MFFKNIKNNLTKHGSMTFDVSLKKNSIKHLKQLNRKGKYKGIRI